jgi:hypothetical protein
MENENALRRYYQPALITANVAVVAVFVFVMHLPTVFQISLLIASALVFGSILRSRDSSEPPCGADLGGEAIARPRPGFSP